MSQLNSPFRPDVLAGKVALITGGGSGICYGIAEQLAKHGAKIVIMGRREEVLSQAVKAFQDQGYAAAYYAGDVRNYDAAEAAIAKTLSTFGHLDILVNGAAGNFLCPTEKLTPNGFRSVIEIDLIGTFNMSHAAFDSLKSRGQALILNISATLHYQGTLMQAHVMAAKAGVDALGRNLACEWGPYGIRVCGIAPGPIGETEGMRRLSLPSTHQQLIESTPIRRLGKIDDIAMAAVYLSTDAASYITGETLVVDGGQWLAKPPFVTREIWEQLAAKKTK